MMDGQAEMRLVGGCLALRCSDVGFRPIEVDLLLGLAPGTWPLSEDATVAWAPTEAQEVRARRLIEICAIAITLMGDGAKSWIRTDNMALDGMTPIEFMIACDHELRFMRDALRREAV